MLCVDRIEGGYAVCYEDRIKTDIPLKAIEGKVCEGDILVKNGDSYRIDRNSSEKRKKEIIQKQNSLWE